MQATLVMVLWAACFPLIDLGLDNAPHLYFAALRGLLAGVSLLIVALLLRRSVPRAFAIWRRLAAIGIGATTLAFLGMIHGAEYISPGLATVIANIQPLLAAVLGYLLLKERLDGKGKAGMAAGFLGIALIAWPGMSLDGNGFGVGVAYLLLSALGITFSNVLIRRVAGSVDALMGMAIQLLIGSLPLLLAAALTERATDIAWTGAFWASLLGLSLAGTALAYWLWCKVLESVELNRANVFTYLVPVLGLMMGAIFYQERFGVMAIAGTALIVAATVLVNSKQARRHSTGGLE